MTNDEVKEELRKAYYAGFKQSGEGYNGEYWQGKTYQTPHSGQVPANLQQKCEDYIEEVFYARHNQ